jgi:peptide/nickel transport system substrate-binding protein
VQKQKSQIQLIPSGGSRYIALNTKLKPFDDINVRKAVLAGMDRNALLLTRGGKAVGSMATHFIPPGISGYEEAGGAKGFGLDFISEDGSPQPDVSAKYFKAAGFASGKYEGKDKILMVGDNTGVAAKTSQVAAQQLKNMGFDVTLRLVEHATMYTRYCNTPSAKVQICSNVGWLKDFADGQTILDPTFNGKNILEQGNSNWPQLDVPAINEAMDKAELLPKDQRAQAWADIDKMVTEQAPAVPWIFDNDVLLESANVNGVASTSNALWEIPWTSVK